MSNIDKLLYIEGIGEITQNLNIGGNLNIENNLNINNSVNISGNIIPTEDNTYTLGSTTKAFKDVYIGPGSLYINGKKILEQEESTNSNITTTNITTEPDNHIKIKTSGDGTIQLRSEDEINLFCVPNNSTSTNGNIKIKNTSNGNIELDSSNGNIKLDSSDNIELNSSDNIELNSSDNIELNSNGSINIIKKNNVDSGDINIKNLNTSSSDSIEIETKGGNISLIAGSPGNIVLNSIPLNNFLTTSNLNSLSTLTVDGISTFNNNVTIADNKTLTVGGNCSLNDNILYFRSGTDTHHSIAYAGDDTDATDIDGVEIKGHGEGNKAIFRLTDTNNNNVLLAGYNDRLQIYKKLTVDGTSTFNDDVTIDAGKTLTVNGTSTLTISDSTIKVDNKVFTFPNGGGTLALADSSGSGTFDQHVIITNGNTLTVAGTSTFNNNMILNKSGVNEFATIEVQSDWVSQLKLHSTHQENNGYKCDICLQHDNNTIGTKANIQLNAASYFLDFIMSKPAESTNPVGFKFSGGDMQLNNNLYIKNYDQSSHAGTGLYIEGKSYIEGTSTSVNNQATWHLGFYDDSSDHGRHNDKNFHFSNKGYYGNYQRRGHLGWTAGNGHINFTGQHRCVPANLLYYTNINDYIGMIVYATGNYKTYDSVNDILSTNKNAITIDDSLPIIELTNTRKCKSVFGIISAQEEIERVESSGIFKTLISNKYDDKRIYINSLGEGAIWIVNTNGNLENGDYIQSSNITGYGEKQDDDILHNYTVAKITCDCNFDLNSDAYNCVSFSVSGVTHIKAFVGCTYHCG